MAELMSPENIATRIPLRKLNSATVFRFCSSESSPSLDSACHADKHDADEGYDRGYQRDDAAGRREHGGNGFIAFEHRRDQRSRRRRQPCPHGEAKADAQISYHQPPRQSAESPGGAAQETIRELMGWGFAENGQHIGRRHERQAPGHKNQAKNRIHQPVAFPCPSFDLLETAGKIRRLPGRPA